MRLVNMLIFIAIFGISFAACAEDNPGARWMQKAQQPGITDLQKNVYEHLAQVHTFKLPMMNPGGVIWSPEMKDSELTDIYDLGFDAIPFLAEAFEDDTPTRTGMSYGPNNRKILAVCDIAALLIRRLADRDFYGTSFRTPVTLDGVGRHPEFRAKFREIVQGWYFDNKNRTPDERKILEVLDDNYRNRLKAIKWVGTHRISDGQLFLIQRINNILAEKRLATHKDELSACALTLEQLGETRAAESVRRMLDETINDSFNNKNVKDVQDLFQAYRSWALLGNRNDAISHLHRLFANILHALDKSSREEYIKQLVEAEKW